MLLHARDYRTGERIDVVRDDGIIQSITPTADPAAACDGWIAPAFFDLQINGGLGVSFNSASLTGEQISTVLAECRRHGIGGLLPTLVTNSLDALSQAFRTLTTTIESDSLSREMIPGFHLEGPWISPEDGPRGAHPNAFVRDPSFDEFCRLQDAAGGRIRLVTLAPERPGAFSFIEALVKLRIVVAVGHTAATPAQIRDAVRAGARLSTHLGNGSHAVLPRHENYIWEQLAADELWASIITDGHHIPASVAKCIVRVKTPRRTIITCDAGSLAGMPPGQYSEWGATLEVQSSGKVVLAGTPYLAGSGLYTDSCVSTAIRMTGVSLAEAIDMASARPRELLGLPAWDLSVGSSAPLVLFDWSSGGDVTVREVI